MSAPTVVVIPWNPPIFEWCSSKLRRQGLPAGVMFFPADAGDTAVVDPSRTLRARRSEEERPRWGKGKALQLEAKHNGVIHRQEET